MEGLKERKKKKKTDSAGNSFLGLHFLIERWRAKLCICKTSLSVEWTPHKVHLSKVSRAILLKCSITTVA